MHPALVGMIAGGGVALTSAALNESVNGSAGLAYYTLADTGLIAYGVGSGLATLFPWLFGGLPSQYETRMDVISGAFSQGSINTWVAGAPQSWAVIREIDGVSTVSAMLRIRDALSGVEFPSVSITMEVHVTGGGGGVGGVGGDWYDYARPHAN